MQEETFKIETNERDVFDESTQISPISEETLIINKKSKNREEFEIFDENKKKEITLETNLFCVDKKEISIGEMTIKGSKPRGATSHILKINNFPKIEIDDNKEIKYLLNNLSLNEEDFSKFKSFFVSFYSKKIQDKVNIFTNYFKNELLDIVFKNIETIKIKDVREDNFKKCFNYNIPSVVKTKKQSFFNCGKLFNCLKSKHISNKDYQKINRNSKFSLLIKKFVDDLIQSVTNLVNEYSDIKNCNNFFEYNLNDLINKVSSNKLSYLLNRKNLDKILKVELDNFSSFFNLDKTIKNLNSNLNADSDYIQMIDDAKLETICLKCNLNLRNTLFIPCMHLLYCSDCSHSLEINSEIFFKVYCVKCEEEINDIRLLSLSKY